MNSLGQLQPNPDLTPTWTDNKLLQSTAWEAGGKCSSVISQTIFQEFLISEELLSLKLRNLSYYYTRIG